VALPGRPPEVRVVFPRGDQRVSSLEELELAGEAQGEYGLLKYGVGYSRAGQEPQFVTLGQGVPAKVKCQFTNQISLENLGATVDQLVSYFAWADDHGPDGRVRRTFSDVFLPRYAPLKRFSARTSPADPGTKAKIKTRVEIKARGWRNCRSKLSWPRGNFNKKRRARPAPETHEDISLPLDSGAA